MREWITVVGIAMLGGGLAILGIYALVAWSERKFYRRHR